MVLPQRRPSAADDGEKSHGGENGEGNDGGMNELRSRTRELDRRREQPERAADCEARVESTEVKEEGRDGLTEEEWRPALEQDE